MVFQSLVPVLSYVWNWQFQNFQQFLNRLFCLQLLRPFNRCICGLLKTTTRITVRFSKKLGARNIHSKNKPDTEIMHSHNEPFARMQNRLSKYSWTALPFCYIVKISTSLLLFKNIYYIFLSVAENILGGNILVQTLKSNITFEMGGLYMSFQKVHCGNLDLLRLPVSPL